MHLIIVDNCCWDKIETVFYLLSLFFSEIASTSTLQTFLPAAVCD